LTGGAGTPREVAMVFVRHPSPGRTKTRLAEAIGDDAAVRVYRRMAERVVAGVEALSRPGLLRWGWAAPAGEVDTVARWLGPGLAYFGQPEGDLGARLREAFRAAFAAGAERVVVVGTDCVDAGTACLEAAFEALREADAVIGPAEDGGYYLLGLARPVPQVFEDIPWSTSRAGAETVRRLQEAGASVRLLGRLLDVDTVEDLRRVAASHPELCAGVELPAQEGW
jgi:rSAM/selenodomain-associated transferase 1